MNTIVYKARVLLINMGKMLPFILCCVIAIAYIESFISLAIQDFVVWNGCIILNNSISWFVGKYFEYDLVTLVALLVFSISTETCYWNKLACLYLGINLFEKSYFDFELEPWTIYTICIANIIVAGYLTYKGIAILTKTR